MNEFCIGLQTALLRSSFALTLAAILVLLFLRIVPVASPGLRRMLWCAVVIQGCLIARIPVTLPAIPFLSAVIPHNKGVPVDWESIRRSDDFRTAWNDPTTPSIPFSPVKTANRFPIATIIICLWGLGIAVFFGRSGWHYVRFLRQVPEAIDTPHGWHDEWESLQRQSGVRRTAILHPTEDLGPLLYWHPRGYRLIIPAGVWRLLEPHQRLMIFRHELAHLQRGDIWKSFALRLLALPHWFNPLAWWAVNRFDDDAECACDDAIRQSSQPDAIEYARTLLLFGGSQPATLLSHQATGGYGLADRIRRLIAPNSRKDSNMKKMVMMTAVIGFSLLQLLRFQSLADDKTSAPQATSPSPEATQGLLIELDGTTVGFNNQSSLSSKSAAGGRTEAVVEMAQVFVELAEFIQDREALKLEIAAKELKAKEKQAEISRLSMEMNAASGESASLLQKQVEAARKEFETWRKECSQVFLRKESEIYLKAHNNVRAEIAQYAKENGIRLVRKREQPNNSGTITLNASVGTLVLVSNQATGTISAINVPASAEKPVPAADSKATNNDTGTRIFRNDAQAANGNPPQAVNVILTNSASQSAGVAISSANAGNGIYVTSSNVKPSEGTALNGIALNLVTNVPVPDAKDLLTRMNQKEILYAEPGDEFDITQEIVTRMNTKFAQDAAAKNAK